MTTIIQLLDRCNVEIVVTFADGTWTAPPSENILVGQARLAAIVQRWPLASVETRKLWVDQFPGSVSSTVLEVAISVGVRVPMPEDLRPARSE
jgi:hypothetical protein